MTENDSPLESVGKTKEERHKNAENAWRLILSILRLANPDTSETIELESVEVLDDDNNE